MTYQYDPNMHEVRRRGYISPTAIDAFIGEIPNFVKQINIDADTYREHLLHASSPEFKNFLHGEFEIENTLSDKSDSPNIWVDESAEIPLNAWNKLQLNSVYGKLVKHPLDVSVDDLRRDAQDHFKRMEAIKQKRHFHIQRVWFDAENKPLGGTK